MWFFFCRFLSEYAIGLYLIFVVTISLPMQGCQLEVVWNSIQISTRRKSGTLSEKTDTNHSLLSLDGFTDSEGNVIDFVVDEVVDVAEIVVHAVMMVDGLKAILPL